MHWLAIVVLFAAGDSLLGPAEYLKILADSKIHYNAGLTPSKTPPEIMTCPRRDERTRVVAGKDGKKLVNWDVKLEALNRFNEGEELFRKEDYAGAAEKYKAGLAIDPQAIAGYFFLGDALLFGKDDAAAALEQYRKGLALDPTMPSGHFFAQTALVKLGRNDEAREEAIKALTYYPAYESVWKAAAVSGERWKIQPVVRHKFEPPEGLTGGNAKDGFDIYLGANGEWGGYAICKAAWAHEPRFRKQHIDKGWTLDEERACVANQLMAAFNKAEEKVEAMPPLERHLWDVAQAKLLDGYILFEIIGQHCPLAMSTLDDEGLKQVDGYIRKYVIVAR